MRHILLAATLIACVASLAYGQDRAPPPKEGDTVKLEGCAEPGVEFQCVVLRSGGTTYDVTRLGAKPGDYLHGEATVTSAITTCMQGLVVKDYRPRYNPDETPRRCGAASRPR